MDLLKAVVLVVVDNTVCVLFSGGIDSTACISFYKKTKTSVMGLYLDYGQLAAKREMKAIRKISSQLDIKVKIISLSNIKMKKGGLIIGRNAFLLTTALLVIPNNVSVISMGIHSGTDYSDCNKRFINKMQQIFDIYTLGAVQIDVPFIEWTKVDIWNYCKDNNFPLNDTYSCEIGLDQPCNRCLSCKDIKELNAL